MFQRIQKKSLTTKIRDFIYPSMGLSRVMHYYMLRISRINGSSHSIALGFAIGATIAFTPLVGMHFLLTICFCFILRGTIVAGLLGSLLGNPWTWSVMWLLSYKIGVLMGFSGGGFAGVEGIHGLGEAFKDDILRLDFSSIIRDVWPIFYPILLGTIPVGLAFGIFIYFPVKFMINKIRNRSKDKDKDKIEIKSDYQYNTIETFHILAFFRFIGLALLFLVCLVCGIVIYSPFQYLRYKCTSKNLPTP